MVVIYTPKTYDKQYQVNDKVSIIHKTNKTNAFPVKLGMNATTRVATSDDR